MHNCIKGQARVWSCVSSCAHACILGGSPPGIPERSYARAGVNPGRWGRKAVPVRFAHESSVAFTGMNSPRPHSDKRSQALQLRAHAQSWNTRPGLEFMKYVQPCKPGAHASEQSWVSSDAGTQQSLGFATLASNCH